MWLRSRSEKLNVSAKHRTCSVAQIAIIVALYQRKFYQTARPEAFDLRTGWASGGSKWGWLEPGFAGAEARHSRLGSEGERWQCKSFFSTSGFCRVTPERL